MKSEPVKVVFDFGENVKKELDRFGIAEPIPAELAAQIYTWAHSQDGKYFNEDNPEFKKLCDLCFKYGNKDKIQEWVKGKV